MQWSKQVWPSLFSAEKSSNFSEIIGKETKLLIPLFTHCKRSIKCACPNSSAPTTSYITKCLFSVYGALLQSCRGSELLNCLFPQLFAFR